jgi:hypothetical protein
MNPYPSSPGSQPAASPAISRLQLLIGMVTEPGKSFDALRRAPNFLLPLALSAILTAVGLFLYYQRVDGDWLITQLLYADPNMTAAKAEAARKYMTIGIMQWSAAIGAPVGIAVVSLLIAVYYLLAGKVTGTALSFKEALAFQCWSALPGVLSAIAMVAMVLTMNPQTRPEEIMPTRLDTLLFHLPLNHPWKAWVGWLDLTHFWSLALAIIGWKRWSQGSWLGAATVVLLPYVVILGTWAAIIVARH